MKRSIARVHYTSTFGVFFLLVLLFGTTWVIIEYRDLDDTLRQFDQEFIAKRKEGVKEEVGRVVSYIEYMRSQVRKRVETELRNRVYEAHTVATSLYTKYHGTMPDKALEELIKNSLRPVIYNNGRGYYFVTRTDGVEMVFGDRPELEGRNILDLRDSNGKYVIQDMIALAKERGEDYYEYTWSRPGDAEFTHKKISFIKYFEPFDWIIGTGEYMEDMEREIKAEVLERIANIRYGEDGYIFIFRYDGVFISHLAKEFIGKNKMDMQDAKGLHITEELLRIARDDGGGFLHYLWSKPGTDVNREKITYVRGVDEWGWVVGTGVYLEDVQAAMESASQRFYRNLWRKGFLAVVLGSLAILITMLAVRAFFRRLDKNLSVFMDAFERAVDKGQPMDEDGLVFQEFRILAQNVNTILDKRQETMQELRKSEVRFRRLLEHSPMPMVVVHGEEVEYVNTKFVEMLGYTREDIPTVRHWWQMAFPDKTQRVQARQSWDQAVQEAGDTGQEASVAGQEVRCRDGHIRIMEFRSMSIGPRAIIIGIDITKQRQAEENLAKLNKDLERLVAERTGELHRKALELEKVNKQLMALDQLKSSLLTSVSHDVRTPLTSILGFTALIRRDMNNLLKVLPDGQESARRIMENLEIIILEGQRVSQLLNDYLDLTRIESGQTIWNDRVINPHELIAYAMNTAKGFQSEEHDLRFVLKADENLPPLLMDWDKGLQVLTNLLNNAVRFSPPKAEVVVEARVRKPFLEVQVTDFGPGIPAAECERVFERFYRLRDSDTFDSMGRGAGLGLAICREIVEHYEGRVWVESEENMGSTFTVWLPLA